MVSLPGFREIGAFQDLLNASIGSSSVSRIGAPRQKMGRERVKPSACDYSRLFR